MICLFCNKMMELHRSSLRFLSADEFECKNCTVDGMRNFFMDEYSRYIEHRDYKRKLLFQEVSIGWYNIEHSINEKTTKIGQWRRVHRLVGGKPNVEMFDLVTIPLNQELNTLTLEQLEKKVKLYMTFS